MTQLQLVTDLTNNVVLIAFLGAVFFIASYSLTAKWWRHAIGTTLVMLDAGLVLALGPSVVHRFLGFQVTQEAFAWYYCASITVVAVAVWWRSFVMIRANRAGRREARRERKQ